MTKAQNRRKLGRLGEVVPQHVSDNGRNPSMAGVSVGADDGIRTRDPHLGKVLKLVSSVAPVS